MNLQVVCIVMFSLFLLSAGLQAGDLPPGPEPILKTLKTGHPRLILTDERVAEIRKVTATDPLAASYLQDLKATGESILEQKPVERVLIGPRLLDKSRTAFSRITTLGLLYRLDGDPKWAKRAIEEMKTAAEFSDWNPSHYLDTAEMTAALGLGYDWLYDAMTPEERAVIGKALIEKGLSTSLPLYSGHSRPVWAANSNWNCVCNGGMIVGSLAIADINPQLSEEVLFNALNCLERVLPTYAPDGAWPEGPAYWDYATSYTLYAVYSLKSALGTDFGIMEKPGMRQTGYFVPALTGPTGLPFNFADSDPAALYIRPRVYGLALCFDDPSYAYLARSMTMWKHASSFDVIFFDPRGDVSDTKSISLDSYFSRISVATFRSSSTDQNAVFVGFKGGDNAAPHSHLDLGSFVMESDGVRWADDLGRDDYNAPGYWDTKGPRWQYYRLINKGHNTLTINGMNQDPQAEAPIVKFVSRPGMGFAVADLTKAYAPSDMDSVQRGIKLGGGRRYVLVQDEIRSNKAIDLVWAMHTQAAIDIDPTGRNATLSLNGKALSVRLLNPEGARFTQEEVVLDLPQKPIKNERKLLIHLSECSGQTCIVVLFSPGTEDFKPTSVVSLEKWR